MSAAENPLLAQKYKDHKFEVKSVPGAGNKLMKVALGRGFWLFTIKAIFFLYKDRLDI